MAAAQRLISVSGFGCALILCASCTGTRPGEPGTDADLAPPVTEWLEFAADNREALAELLGGLQVVDGQDPAQAERWIDQTLRLIPTDESWSYTLGAAPASTVVEAGYAPFLTLPTDPGLVLTRVCSHLPGCASCVSAVAEGGGAVGQAVPDSSFSGICATLSTAYSLVYILEKRTEFEDLGTVVQRGDKKFWRRGFLQTIREDQGHDPKKGTPRNQIKRAYEKYQCTCADEIKLSAAQSVDDWKTDLRRRTSGNPPEDCHYIITGTEPADSTKKWAHDMHVDAVDDAGTIGVANTGIQGSGTGDDVPVILGYQEWEIGGTPAKPQITCTASTSGDLAFWNSKPIVDASYICCKCP